MRSIEQRSQSLDVFSAYKDGRLQGKDLSNARGGGYSLLVAYRHNALKFDTVVSHVGRTITGAQLIVLAVREPDSSSDFYVTLKGRKGLVSLHSLKGTKFEEFGDMPEEAVLSEDEELNPDIEADFTPADEKRFQKLHSIEEQRKIPMGGGIADIPPHQPGGKP